MRNNNSLQHPYENLTLAKYVKNVTYMSISHRFKILRQECLNSCKLLNCQNMFWVVKPKNKTKTKTIINCMFITYNILTIGLV